MNKPNKMIWLIILTTQIFPSKTEEVSTEAPAVDKMICDYYENPESRIFCSGGTFNDVTEWFDGNPVKKVTFFQLSDVADMDKNNNVDKILSKLVDGSAKTLRSLSLDHLGLTSIPSTLRSFTQLNELWLTGNSFQNAFLEEPLVVTSTNLRWLALSSAGIKDIGPDSFKGYLSGTTIILDDNELTGVNSEAFQHLLEPDGIDGIDKLSVNLNKIVCDEDTIKWLVCNKNDLLSKVSGSCDDDVPFEELNPSDFGC